MSALAWRGFRVVPDDVLFFRDGKPSTRGDDHYLHSLFPPQPSTLYGALRTRRLMEASVALGGLSRETWPELPGELRTELGEWGRCGSLALRGPWLVREEGEVLVPAPLDLGLVFESGPQLAGGAARSHRGNGIRRRPTEVVRWRPVASGGAGRWSHPLGILEPAALRGGQWVPWEQERRGPEPQPASGWFLTPQGLGAWRRGEVPAPEEMVHAGELWADEVRTGVGLEPGTRTSSEGMLYTFGFIRLLPRVSLGFEVAGSAVSAGGRLRLGGEGRTAELLAGPPFPAANPLAGGGGGLVAVSFATSALSATGAWPPAGFAAGELEGSLGGHRCRLVGACLRGATLVGGWDLAKRRPKPLRRAIPAGSVFLFEPLDGGSAAEVAAALHGSSLSDFPDEGLARQGFGLALAGVTS